MTADKQHGGSRKRSGRKSLGRLPWQVRTKPETKRILEAKAEQEGHGTVGELLEKHYGTE